MMWWGELRQPEDRIFDFSLLANAVKLLSSLGEAIFKVQFALDRAPQLVSGPIRLGERGSR